VHFYALFLKRTRALAIMVQRIRNGRVSDRTRRHILASVLVAPEKKDDEPRPITVCEALYKMAAFGALADVAAFRAYAP
jgi:hypothetical protein